MPTGPSTTDSNGIRLYGEDDLIATLWSDFMNLGLISLSAAFTLDRGRLTTLETALNNPTTYVAVDGTARDTHWGVPSNATQRLALQNKGATTVRLDKGWTERYYAGLTDGGTNSGGQTAAGWYPVAGVLPFVSLGMSAGQNTGAGTYASCTWDTERSDRQDWHSTSTNPSRITVQIGGRYRISAHAQMSSLSSSNYLGLNFAVNGTALGYSEDIRTGNTVNHTSVVISTEVILAATDYVEVQSIGPGTPVALTVAQSSFQLEYIGPA